MKASERTIFSLVGICFFISGAAGLIYQVAWFRYLALFLGHTSYAVIAVLVAFMGGLAAGNAWMGSRVDRSVRPLAFYGVLEVVLGLYAIVFPSYFSLCHDWFIRLARSTQPGSTSLLALKFLFSLLTVLAPTVLMGATFPVLTRFVTRSLGHLRERVAALYSINSAGAALGCLVADFWWIPNSGLDVAIFRGAGLNFAAGLLAQFLSRHVEEGAGSTSATDANTATLSEPELANPGEARLALIAIGISGFVAMLYEVAWTRVLGLVLGASTHAFSLMLVTFITGIAAGSWLVYRWKGLRRNWEAFGWAELVLALSLFGSMFFYGYLSYWFVKLTSFIVRKEAAYPLYQAVQALICFAVMFVPTVCLGMTLPLVSRIATVELSRVGRTVGKIFAVNTLGTIFGTIVTGLWLMPQFGLARTFAIGIALNAILGLIVLAWRPLANRRSVLVLPVLLTFALIWLAGSSLDWTWQRAFSLGLWRAPHPPETLASMRASLGALPLEFHKDGACATVDVKSLATQGAEHKSLSVNGKVDASTELDMITQLLLGHLPLMLHQEARQVLVVGLGSGITCGAVAAHTNVAGIDAVEISPEVVQAARLFANVNGHVLKNPKFRLAVEDAKAFLQTTDKKYDVIVSEPSNPWMAGVAAVFSLEYYQTCAAHLNPSGLMAQWMHDYETSDETVEMVLRTFLTTFPYTSIWQPIQGDMILVGSTTPWSADLNSIARHFEEPAVGADLARANLLTVPALLAHEVISVQNGTFAVPPGPVHSDFLPALEPTAEKGFFLNRTAQQWRACRDDFSPRASTLLGRYLRRNSLTASDLESFANDFRTHGMPEARLFNSLLQRWRDVEGHAPFPMDLWALVSEQSPPAAARAARLETSQPTLIEQAASNPIPLRGYASDLMQAYRWERSLFYVPPTTNLEAALQRLIEVDPGRRRLSKLNLAEIVWDRGEDARCLELGRSALDPNAPDGGSTDFSTDPVAAGTVLYCMAESLFRAGKLAEAWATCQTAKVSGYINHPQKRFPLLDLTYRKIQTYANQTQPQPQSQ